MTYSKYIDLQLCCFIPGKVRFGLDRIFEFEVNTFRLSSLMDFIQIEAGDMGEGSEAKSQHYHGMSWKSG